jgi:hypothetical protein
MFTPFSCTKRVVEYSPLLSVHSRIMRLIDPAGTVRLFLRQHYEKGGLKQ